MALWSSGMHASATQVDWDSEAATYAAKRWPYIDSYYNLADLTSITPDMTILDVGCGVGHMGVLAAAKQGSPKNVYFFDQSKKMIEKAKSNMRAIWGDSVHNSHFQVASMTTKKERTAILGGFGQLVGFDIVCAKDFVGQFLPNAQPAVFNGLVQFCREDGRVVCDVPQPAISRDVIYNDPAALTCFATRTMFMAEEGALPNDLGPLHKRASWQTSQADVLVRKEDCDRFAAHTRDLVPLMGNCAVIKAEPSFRIGDISGQTNHGHLLFTRAINRTTLQEHPLNVRVDVARREWIQGKRSSAPWGHRFIELPLSFDVAFQPVITRPLEDIARAVPPSEARKLKQIWKNQ